MSLVALKRNVGFVGAGNMSGALVRGLLRGGLPGASVFVTDIDAEKAEALRRDTGVGVCPDLSALLSQADVLVMATKPPAVVPLLRAHRSDASGKLVLSVAAGVSTAQIEEALGDGARVIRVMPNTPALIGEGATGVCRGKHATDEDVRIALLLTDAVGLSREVSEGMMDAVTGLSGSGPAFIMLVIESMADGAVRAGLPRSVALELAAQTVKGSAALVLETGKHPGELKDMVTSPGGTTIAGVEALEAHGLRRAMIAAVTAAAARSRELSNK